MGCEQAGSAFPRAGGGSRAALRRRRGGAWAFAGEVVKGAGFAIHHVAVEIGRAAHGLAGVADDEIEAIAGVVGRAGRRLRRSGCGARSRPKISRRSPQSFEVGFGGEALGGIAREAGGDDELGAGAEELDAGLVADLDAAAGEQGDAAAEVGGLGAFAVVEVGAVRAELVVEVVDARGSLLADVAVLRLDHLAEVGVVGDFAVARSFSGGRRWAW